MKKIKIILYLSFFITFLLSACTKDQEENTTDPTDTPSPQSSNSNQVSSPNPQIHGVKTIKINQDLTLTENTLNIDAAGDLAYGHPIYYGNSNCVLANINRKFLMDPWTKKQLKTNESYKVFGFELDHSVYPHIPNRLPYIRLTIFLTGETPELVYLWIDCFGDEAAQISSPSDIEKLLDNIISFVSEEDSTTDNLLVFGSSNHLIGSDKSLLSKTLQINQNFSFNWNIVRQNSNTATIKYSYENEKCSLSIIEKERPIEEDHSKNKYNEFPVHFVEFRKGQNLLLHPFSNTIKIVARVHSSSKNIPDAYVAIKCTDETITLSTSPSDIEKLLDVAISFSE